MEYFVFGRSIRGAAHIREGTACQDSCRKTLRGDGSVILAAADGHGSKASPYSRTGSRIAVNVFHRVMGSLCDSFEGKPDKLFSYLSREGESTLSRCVETEWKRRVIKRHRRNKRPFTLGSRGEKDLGALYRQYGTTLLGLMVTPTFLFALQIGDGDICCVRGGRAEKVIVTEKILGVETHSLCRENAWEKIGTVTRRVRFAQPTLFTLTTDGFANSYGSEEDFLAAVGDYRRILIDYGPGPVKSHLPVWLRETSDMGCGDDITMLIAYLPGDKAPADGID